jgi:3D (Asp-Asp-Asp) domain-containing protein
MRTRKGIARRRWVHVAAAVGCIILPRTGAHAAGHGTGALRRTTAQPLESSSDVINVGQDFTTSITATCYDANGNKVTDTVTLTQTGAPDTGGAKASFNPNPIVTFTQTSTFKVTTTKKTDAMVYAINITGTGPVCGQYGSLTIPLTVNPILSLMRQDLLTVVATGDPANGGSIAYQTETAAGQTIAPLAMASGNTATTNPTTTSLSDPANPSPTGAPSPGGLGKYTVAYTVAGLMATNDKANPFKVPVFGMSCYYTALQSDWGTQPDHCKSVTIHGTRYAGAITDPDGYSGAFCSSFIAEVVLQGSGVLNDGTDIQYDPSSGLITSVTAIDGADGTPVVAGQTVARARSIIPGIGVHVDVDNVGTGLLANDTGGAIQGYRLDFYQGAGKRACAGFSNPMGVADCSPEQAKCPGSALK